MTKLRRSLRAAVTKKAKNAESVKVDVKPDIKNVKPVIKTEWNAPCFQRRYFTNGRQERAKSFLLLAETPEKPFGEMGSDTWVENLLVFMDEPSMLTEANIREWMTKNPNFFTIVRKRENRRVSTQKLKVEIPNIKNESGDDDDDDVSIPEVKKDASPPGSIPQAEVEVKLKSQKIDYDERMEEETVEIPIPEGTKRLSLVASDSGIEEILLPAFKEMEIKKPRYQPPPGADYKSQMSIIKSIPITSDFNDIEPEIIDLCKDSEDSGVSSFEEPLIVVDYSPPHLSPADVVDCSVQIGPQTLTVNSDDFLDFAKTAGCFKIVPGPNSTNSFRFYTHSSVSVPYEKLAGLETNLSNYDTVLKMYDYLIDAFETWHGFLIEPRNMRANVIFKEMKVMFNKMQEEMVSYELSK